MVVSHFLYLTSSSTSISLTPLKLPNLFISPITYLNPEYHAYMTIIWYFTWNNLNTTWTLKLDFDANMSLYTLT